MVIDGQNLDDLPQTYNYNADGTYRKTYTYTSPSNAWSTPLATSPPGISNVTRYCLAALFLLPLVTRWAALALVRMTRCDNCCQKDYDAESIKE